MSYVAGGAPSSIGKTLSGGAPLYLSIGLASAMAGGAPSLALAGGAPS